MLGRKAGPIGGGVTLGHIDNIMRKYLVGVVAVLSTATVLASECLITRADNPNVTHAINPNVTYKWNPDVTYAINPNVTYSINPNVTYKYNPNVTYSINPNVTPSLNPNVSDWTGFYVCTPEGELVGASVIANEDVMVIYTGENWIGHFVTNRKSGYNFFNRDNEWKGFLVPTGSGGFAFFDREKEWVFSLVK